MVRDRPDSTLKTPTGYGKPIQYLEIQKHNDPESNNWPREEDARLNIL